MRSCLIIIVLKAVVVCPVGVYAESECLCVIFFLGPSDNTDLYKRPYDYVIRCMGFKVRMMYTHTHASVCSVYIG